MGVVYERYQKKMMMMMHMGEGGDRPLQLVFGGSRWCVAFPRHEQALMSIILSY